MMKKRVLRGISLVLVFCMLVTILPASVIAEQDDIYLEDIPSDYEAYSVDEYNYSIVDSYDYGEDEYATDNEVETVGEEYEDTEMYEGDDEIEYHAYVFSEKSHFEAVSNFITAPMVAVGHNHFIALENDGTVWSWGGNANGQLGDGTTIHRPTPAKIQNLNNVISVTASANSSLALRSDGTVWAWGVTSFGSTTVLPTQIANLNNVIAITSNTALRDDGTVWQWNNSFGSQPTQIQDIDNVIATTGRTFLQNNGSVWALNSSNQLTQVQNLNNIVAISSQGAVRDDGTVWTWNNWSGFIATQVQNIDNAVAIHSELNLTVVLRSNGTIWAWGNDLQVEQMGDINNVVSISTFTETRGINTNIIALKNDGTVWSWSGSEIGNFIPTQITGENGVGYLNLGTSEKPTVTPPELSTAGYYLWTSNVDGTPIRHWFYQEYEIIHHAPIDIRIHVEYYLINTRGNKWYRTSYIEGLGEGSFWIYSGNLSRYGTNVSRIVLGDEVGVVGREMLIGGSIEHYPPLDNVFDHEAIASIVNAIVWEFCDDTAFDVVGVYWESWTPNTTLLRKEIIPHFTGQFIITAILPDGASAQANIEVRLPDLNLNRKPIEVGVNHFSFANQRHDFFGTHWHGVPRNGTYRLTEPYLSVLLYQSQMRNSHRRDVRNRIGSEWGGSCAGMAWVLALTMAEELTPGFFQPNPYAYNLHRLQRPYINPTTMNLVNYYQLLQFTPALRGIARDVGRMNEDAQLRRIVDYMKGSDYPVYIQFTLFNKNTNRTSGHAVLGHRIIETEHGYEICIWDPNSTIVTLTTLNIDKNQEGGLSNARFYPGYERFGWTNVNVWLGLPANYHTLGDWNIQNSLSRTGRHSSIDNNEYLILAMRSSTDTESATFIRTNSENFTIVSSSGLSATIVNGNRVSGMLDIGRGFPLNSAEGELEMEFNVPNLSYHEVYKITPHDNGKMFRATMIYDNFFGGFLTEIQAEGEGIFTFGANGSINAKMTNATSITLASTLDETDAILYSTEVFGVATYMDITVDENERKVISSNADSVEITVSSSFAEVTFPNVDMSNSVTVMQDADNVWLIDEYGNTPATRNIPNNSIRYTIRIYRDTDGGIISGGGIYAEKSNATITARPDSGYRFLGWYDSNGVQVSEDVRHTFVVTADKTLIARFAPLTTEGGNDGSNNDGNNNNNDTDTGTGGNNNNDSTGGTENGTASNDDASSQQLLPIVVRPPATTVETELDQNLYQDYDIPTEEPPTTILETQSLPIPPPTQFPFTDVAITAWYYPYVRTVWERGIFQGTAPNRFSPQQSMTRAMFVQMLANYEGINTSEFATSSFNDVAVNAWYFGAVEWAIQLGIVEGVGNNNFAPNTPITREQMAVMLYRYANVTNKGLPQGIGTAFTDQRTISHWAVGGVGAIQRAGIITGRPNGNFDPQGIATRAEVATLFARFLEVIE